MDRSFAIILMAVALPLLVLSCGDPGGVTPDTPPEAPALVSVEPEDGTAGLTGTSLSVMFVYDQNIKLPSAEQGKVSITGGGTVTKVNAYAQAVTVQVDGLEQGKTYTVSIPSGIVTGFKENQPGAAAASVRFTMKEEISYARDPQKTLSDSHATRRAVALYQFLLSQYGTKTLSGVMACSNGWDNTFTDMLGPVAGAYPAISGYDYLFLNWPPKAWNGCPDYGDITPVREAWEAGSLIQVCWHWSVPKSQAAYEARDPNQYAFYVSDNKAFRPKDALVAGTWQHACIDGQIEKLAGYLKLLADADIPVIFRPLHEAAGDYTWGAWFWWGVDGADPCKQLWKYLSAKLTGTYALHNLIWVWTVQTSDAGQLADVEKLEAWYPGDDCVDLVGADLYVAKGTTQSAVFKRVNDSVKGRKMVALSEFGNLLDIDGYFREDAPWLYFLAWNDYENGVPVLYSKDATGNYNWNNSAADWKNALGNAHVLNRGSVTQWK